MAARKKLIAEQIPGVSALQQALASVRLAIANYEQIIFLFFLPSLVSLLGRFYLGSDYTRLLELKHPHFSSHQWLGLYLLIFWLIWSFVNYPATIFFRLQTAKKEAGPAVIESYRGGFKVFWRTWFASIVSALIIFVGLLLLIVPGIIWFRRYIFTPFYAAENPKLSFREVFKRSGEQTRPYSMAIYSTFVLIFLVNIATNLIFASFTIGSLFIYLISYLILFMPALRYVELSSHFKKPSAAR